MLFVPFSATEVAAYLLLVPTGTKQTKSPVYRTACPTAWAEKLKGTNIWKYQDF